MFDKLLVPLDGSDLAELALPYAAEIAGRMESEVTLLHVSESTNPKEHRARQFYLQAKEALAKGDLLHAELHLKVAASREGENDAIAELARTVIEAKKSK